MDIQKKIELIESLIQGIPNIQYYQDDIYLSRVEMVIRKCFGENSRYYKDYSNIFFGRAAFPGVGPTSLDEGIWKNGLIKLYGFLRAMKEELGLEVKKEGKISTINVNHKKEDSSKKNEKTEEEKIQIKIGLIFVLMPMDEEKYPQLKDTLKTIKDSVKKIRNIDDHKYKAKRIDDFETTNTITPLMLKKIRNSEYIIADITYERPNVFYEIGYAHAFKKPVIFIATKDTNLHFDIKDYPTIFFESYADLEKQLVQKLKALIRNK